MFKLSEIKELVKLVDQSSIEELEIENEGARLSIRKPGIPEQHVVQAVPQPAFAAMQAAQPAAAPQAAPAQPAEQPAVQINDDASLHKITSPMVGTFYAAPSPTSPPFVDKGDKVTPKSIVCIVEAMKLMNEIEAEVKGEIVDVLVENGQLVEFGQPLFLVKPE
ncbi:acetyl-CoA carboxylase biotin carboxyl carrier protein [Xylanibacillus composti]|uniref:Biotin carboxyl carrier protein of acetyl-CoA carboxylase n=1 Tax=Xylanibacillus composti TaxID=1572762 RepID=A0A8J4M432_9BACL|nr:acetyl-CoA carboxylase biotin carboxyl carrier protein [Xylanibacillus composti]MDT9726286.1 acetyl-CoA carboxylase biotin carboxyl carrier protein [Xylanibacillus composti]GIQ70685.1 acetyl-CoA carboxylase, biotin carboxyl carrier protein [Xylanibacillus composti]